MDWKDEEDKNVQFIITVHEDGVPLEGFENMAISKEEQPFPPQIGAEIDVHGLYRSISVKVDGIKYIKGIPHVTAKQWIP